MVIKDYYRILEFNTNRVDVEQIKTSYKTLAKKYHPDLNIGNPRAEERFKDINEAYKVLTDANARKKYDRMWSAHIGNKRNTYNSYKQSTNKTAEANATFFSILFGNIKENMSKKTEKEEMAKKGENIETEINVSILEAFNGTDKKVVLRTVTGEMKTFSIKVPSGIRNKEKVRLIGQGKPGKNGGKNGDLFIKINIENNEKFSLYGTDIITSLSLSPWEAALGTKVQIDGIDEISTIHIPAGTQTGDSIKLSQKGYKDGKGGRGDMVVNIKIINPRKLTDIERELFKELKEKSKFNPRNNSNIT